MSEPLHDSSSESIAIASLAPISVLGRKERVINAFASITQFLTWPVAFVVFNIFLCLDIQGRKNFRTVQNPFIIISNHVAFYDSFLFRLVLGLWTRHLPLRFMAVDTFNWRWLNIMAEFGVISFIYSLFGAFVIEPGLGMEKNLERAREIIDAGGNVVIYPEGDIIVTGDIAPFRKGAAALARQTGVSVIPVALKFGRKGWLRRELRINIGGPMSVLAGHSIEEVTDSLRSTMIDLHGRD